MKTIEELAKIGADAALALRPTEYYISISNQSAFWIKDRPTREAFARAVCDAVLADQPAAAVPTWQPIAEWDGKDEVVFFEHGPDDDRPAWFNRHAGEATHFITPPPKPDPFEVWWTKWGYASENKDVALLAWNAALQTK